MKKRALRKSIMREIFQSKARFLSILGIILLGVCFYAGIKATGPVMIESADRYFTEKNLMDGKIISTMGITETDLDLLEKDQAVEVVQPGYSQDINMVSDNRVVRFYSLPEKKKHNLNEFKVIKGHLPEKKGEIALDSLAELYGEYKLGDTLTIQGDKESLDNFNQTEYQVVGFVNSPMFIENMTRGNTQVGKGSIDYFAVIPEANFDMETYTEVYFTYKGTRDLQAYSTAYNKEVAAGIKGVKKNFKTRPADRLAEIKKEAAEPITQAKKELADGEKQLKKAQSELEKGRADLDQGQVDLANAEVLYQQEIANGEAKLASSSQELSNGQAELAVQEQNLGAAQQTLATSKAQLDQAEQQMRAQGIEPWMEIATLQGQISNLQQFAGYLTSIANDMVATATDTPDGEVIPADKLSQWSGSLVNSYVDLSQISTAIMAVSGVPMTPETRPMIIGVAPQLSQAAAGIASQTGPLEQLINTLVPLQQGYAEYQSGLAQYQAGVAQLEAARIQLAEGQVSLNQGYAQLEQAKIEGQAQLAEGRQKLIDAEAKIKDGEASLTTESAKLADGKKELAEKEKALADLKEPDYFYLDREDNPGYSEYHENSKRISSIATVFPVFFFMIAALVSLTTMTRMVDEKRGEIGALKALGYTNWEISQKYIVYATAASLIGSILGLLIGFNVFPRVIIDAYGSLYNLPSAGTVYYASYSIQSIIVALMCTLISSMVVLRYDLFSTPATLMRPKAPKAGQRIFLERLTFIWKRLSFNHKVTARNLFRYKQRMFMTVFGIAGCMALIITGFGVRDSISDVVSIQFSKLWHYQGIVTYNDEATKEETAAYEADVKNVPGLDKRLVLSQQFMRVMEKGKTTQTVTLDVPKETKYLADFVLFNDRKSGEVYKLTDQGAIINEKLAKMFKLKVGDTFELTDSDNRKFPVKIANIVENYAMHFVYMTPSYYQQVFEKEPEYNSELLLFDDKPSSKEEDKISASLMENEQVVNVSFLSQTSKAMDDTIDSLTIVVWVLIISAGTLAFIVLYNLTNINVSERIRELSTIKVLGFYNNEVTMYVYRENNILTVLGILIGCVAGKLLHGFVLETAEVDMLMFSPTIHGMSYLYSALLTLLFSLIVMWVMHRKLRNVDMIEALKSTE
ncbi:FtsX-like permease family protein [Vagococcus sp. BWB3-3]|uniref:FtsX-like permease family protein n=1 Tax=Vagococcus allomyrinae TaxID=2794353 RepID=A0A940P5T2_9ENTE|nr:FtsX-like permease family protein [Vagococcus allomyrinae]MBP1041555.1 FtsX-like permease family protein [Vagococcus allomyrinae]